MHVEGVECFTKKRKREWHGYHCKPIGPVGWLQIFSRVLGIDACAVALKINMAGREFNRICSAGDNRRK